VRQAPAIPEPHVAVQRQQEAVRSGYPLSLQQYGDYFQYQNSFYPLFGLGPSYGNEKLEEIPMDLRGYAGYGYMGNTIVFSCILSRLQVFSQARFQFRRLQSGRPGEYFGSAELAPLEEPEPGRTTSDLLARMELDISLAGNSFIVKSGGYLKRLRPDWCAIALSGYGEEDPDAVVEGYLYWPGGIQSGNDPIGYLREQVAHYAPLPDPLACYRGMSWMTPVIREIMADSGFRDHKIKFLEAGGTVNHLFKVDPASMTGPDFEKWTAAFRANYEGGAAVAKSIFLRAAVDATPLGANFVQSDLKQIQGAGETRIAAAAGVPPIVAGFSEGLQAATYSNYGQARRRFADGTIRWLWQNASASLQTIIRTPPGAQLWYDDRDIPALQEDQLDAAEIQSKQAQTIKALTDAGFEAQSVIDAVKSGDFTRLIHTGLFSVQLQPPGTIAAPQNGSSAVVPANLAG
jgi:Phage portal protein